MSAALLNERASEAGPRAGEWGRSQSQLNVVLLYDDVEFAREARALVNRVARPGAFVVQSRHFHELITPPGPGGIPPETKFAASEADLLVVAIAGVPELPASVKSWFRRWLSRRDPGRRGAMVALFKDRAPEATAALTRIHLETVAALAGLDFFPGQISEPGHAVNWAQPSGTWADAAPDPTRSDTVAPDDSSSVHHWGLNE